MKRTILDSGVPSDKILIEWFRGNYSKMNFTKAYEKVATQVIDLDISQDVHDLDGEANLNTQENLAILKKVWKKLLGNAIIFLKSKDDREMFHDGEIFGTDKLMEIIEEFSTFENLLYGVIDHYREHIAHAFRVFLLGEGLIRESFGFEEVHILCESRISKRIRISPDEKEAMWCIIALTHDIGYPLEGIDRINVRTREMIRQYGKVNFQELAYLFPPQRQAIDEQILRFISSDLVSERRKFATHQQFKYLLKFYRAYERFDHGIISCMVLMRELVFFLESDFLLDRRRVLETKDDAKQFLIRQTILRSIASHNCEEIYHVTGRNFPFLLLICDELQEWGRPKMEEVSKEISAFRTVKINKFERVRKYNGLRIDYEVHFGISKEDEDKKRVLKKSEAKLILEEAGSHFRRKTKKFIKILRSAVGGERRSISLRFAVVDDLDNTRYEFGLRRPPKTKKWLSPEWRYNDKPTTLAKLQEYLPKES